MVKSLVVALLLAVAFIGAFFAIRAFFKNNEAAVYNAHYTWHADVDASGNTEILVRGKMVGAIRDDVGKLVIALNKSVEEAEARRPQSDGVRIDFPRITLQKVEQLVANIEIANDQYLTQKMGSSGAQDYLAGVTYTLTENPGVRSVNFVFNAGDHAMPGVYSRESFTAYKIVNEK